MRPNQAASVRGGIHSFLVCVQSASVRGGIHSFLVCVQVFLCLVRVQAASVKDIIDGSITPDKKYKGVFYRRSTKKYECITPEQMILKGDTLYNVYGDLVLIYGKAGFEGMGIAGLESKDEMDAWMEAKRTKRA